jgi:hypothetical protein
LTVITRMRGQTDPTKFSTNDKWFANTKAYMRFQDMNPCALRAPAAGLRRALTLRVRCGCRRPRWQGVRTAVSETREWRALKRTWLE